MQHDIIIKEQTDPQTQKPYWKADPGTLGDDPDPNKKVRKGDLIRWEVNKGSDVTLFFPDETIFGLCHVKLLQGENITLEVRRIGKDNAAGKLEKNLYAAFCHQPNCFAEGNSSPIIIIEKADA